MKHRIKTLQLIKHSIAIFISFNISLLSPGKCMSVFATICGHSGRKKINFVLPAPLPLLSINYLFHLFKGLTFCPSYSWEVSLYLSLSLLQFSFYLPVFLFLLFHIPFTSLYNLLHPILNLMQLVLYIALPYSWLFLHFLVHTNWLHFYFQCIYY